MPWHRDVSEFFCPLIVLVKETQRSVSILLPMLQRIISISVTLQSWFLFHFWSHAVGQTSIVIDGRCDRLWHFNKSASIWFGITIWLGPSNRVPNVIKVSQLKFRDIHLFYHSITCMKFDWHFLACGGDNFYSPSRRILVSKGCYVKHLIHIMIPPNFNKSEKIIKRNIKSQRYEGGFDISRD